VNKVSAPDPRTETLDQALQLFDDTQRRAYAGNLSEKELEDTLARLREMSRGASETSVRRMITAMHDVLVPVLDEAELERRCTPDDPDLIAHAEAIFASAGRDAGDHLHRLNDGITALEDLARHATGKDELTIAEMAGTLMKMRDALTRRNEL
jgi:hypothetical protein